MEPLPDHLLFNRLQERYEKAIAEAERLKAEAEKLREEARHIIETMKQIAQGIAAERGKSELH